MVEKRCTHGQLLMGLAAVAVAASAVGCAADDEGEFVMSDFAQHGECLTEASPIEPEKFTVRDQVDTIGVFMQTDFRLASTSDAVQFKVYQPEEVRERLGEPIELADPLELVQDDEDFDEPPVVRGQIFAAETCPDIEERFGLRGAVVFEELGSERGESVVGTLVDGEAVSLRDEEVVIGEVTGEWDFSVRVRRPYRHFPDFPEKDLPGPEP